MVNKLNIAIAGATGFVGLELIKKIYYHPSVEIKYLFVKDSIDENIYENLPKEINKLPELKKFDVSLINKCDVFFLHYHILSYTKLLMIFQKKL